MVTLKDIAKLANVSPMTVSRVVNQQYAKVSQQTVERVQRIIKEQGYVPNSSARSLSSKTTRLIAVIIQGDDNALEYPYNGLMAGHICRYVQDSGYSPMLYYVNDYREVTARLRSWHVDGAVFMGMFDKEMQKIQEDNSIPLVFTDSYSRMRQVSNIGLDDYKGGELAGEHLIHMGHKNIAFLGASTDISTLVRQRLDGLRHAMEKAGLNLQDDRIVFERNFEQPVRTLCQGPRRPTAFFAASDIEAIRLMDFLRTLNIQVPDDISVIGFDDLSYSAYSYPRLTTIAQDIRQKAKLAIDMLLRHIDSADAPAENIILNVRLVTRDSVKRL